MTFLEKIKKFFKENWVFIALSAFLILGGLFALDSSDKSYKQLWGRYKKLEQMHQVEKAALEKVNQEKDEKLLAIQKAHDLEKKRIIAEYEKRLEGVAKTSNERRIRIVREAKEDPSTLVKRVEETFSIPYVEAE